MWFEILARSRLRLFASASLKYSPPVKCATVSGILRWKPSWAAMAAIFARRNGGANKLRQSYRSLGSRLIQPCTGPGGWGSLDDSQGICPCPNVFGASLFTSDLVVENPTL